MHTRTTSVLVLVMQLRLILEHFYLHASLPHASNLLPHHDSHNCIMRCLLFLSGRHLRNLFASDSRAPRHDSCAAKYFNYTNRRCTQARGRVRGEVCCCKAAAPFGGRYAQLAPTWRAICILNLRQSTKPNRPYN